jgi:hypothetical protein
MPYLPSMQAMDGFYGTFYKILAAIKDKIKVLK